MDPNQEYCVKCYCTKCARIILEECYGCCDICSFYPILNVSGCEFFPLENLIVTSVALPHYDESVIIPG